MKRLRERLKISETAARMIAVIGVLFGVLLVAGELVTVLVYPFESPLAYARGLLLGCCLSAVKVVLLERALDRSLDLQDKRAQAYASIQAVLRYFLTIAVLLGVFFFPEIFGLFGAILGILALQGAAYITGHIVKKQDIV